jgi:hypothetical protein
MLQILAGFFCMRTSRSKATCHMVQTVNGRLGEVARRETKVKLGRCSRKQARPGSEQQFGAWASTTRQDLSNKSRKGCQERPGLFFCNHCWCQQHPSHPTPHHPTPHCSLYILATCRMRTRHPVQLRRRVDVGNLSLLYDTDYLHGKSHVTML